MKREEYRQGIPADIRTVLPKGEIKPCMRGVLNLDLYNKTGKVEMIEPFEEFVSPVDPFAAPEHNPYVKRREMYTLNPNKPKKEALERHLRAGMTAPEIAEKYDASTATVYNWIRGYGLQGIKGQKLPKSAPVTDMVQHSPTLAEIEQFHTDVEVQELPKVEMDAVTEMKVYHCAKCTENFTAKEYSRLCPTCYTDSLIGPLGMTAKENMSDAEWEANKTIDEAWRNIRSGIGVLEGLYVAGAKKSFRERLREMLTEVVEGLEEEKQ